MADEAAQGTPTEEEAGPETGGPGFDAPNRVGGAAPVALAPAHLDRIDQLSGAIADLTFRVETLLGSTAAFRSSITDRLTDYADLVAKWSMETEGNLDGFRRTSERVAGDTRHVLTEAVALLRRVGDQAEALTTQSVVLEERLADGLAAVAAGIEQNRSVLAGLEEAVAGGPSGPALQSLDERSASLLDGVASLGEGLSHLDDRLAQLAGAVVALAPAPLDLVPVVAELQQRMQVELEVVVDRLTAVVTARPTRAEGPDVAAAMSAFADRLAAIEARLALPVEPPAAVEALATAVGSLRAETAEALTRIGDELARWPAGRAPADPDGVRAGVDELRAELRALADRLAEAPEVPPEIQELAEELRAVRAELSSEAGADGGEAGLLPPPVDAALIDAVYGELQALRDDVAGSGPALDGLTALLETQQELLDELAGEVSALRAVQGASATGADGGQPGPARHRSRTASGDEPSARSTRTGRGAKAAMAATKAPTSASAPRTATGPAAAATKAGAAKAGTTKTASTKAAAKAGATKAGATKAGATTAGTTKAVPTKAGVKKAASTKAASKRAGQQATPARRTPTASASRTAPVPAARASVTAGPAETAQPPVVIERSSRTVVPTPIDRPAPRPAPEVVRTASRPVPLPADEQPALPDPEVVRHVDSPEPESASSGSGSERPARRGLFRRRG